MLATLLPSCAESVPRPAPEVAKALLIIISSPTAPHVTSSQKKGKGFANHLLARCWHECRLPSSSSWDDDAMICSMVNDDDGGRWQMADSSWFFVVPSSIWLVEICELNFLLIGDSWFSPRRTMNIGSIESNLFGCALMTTRRDLRRRTKSFLLGVARKAVRSVKVQGSQQPPYLERY